MARSSRPRKSNRLIASLGVGVLVFAGLVGGWWASQNLPGRTPTSDGITVVASANFWGDIAAQIGGSHVRVSSIIVDPGTDPHLYEPAARDAAQVARADVVVTNGLGYDEPFAKLLMASPNTGRTVVEAARVLGATGTDANPHLWYDLPRVHLVAAAIADALAAKDPAHAAQYLANLATFKKSLEPLLSSLDAIKVEHPGAPVAYTERVAQYLLEAAGLNIVGPVGYAAAIEAGTEPSPADRLSMNALIKSRGVKLLVYNDQADSAVTADTRKLAAASGVPVVGVSETIPSGETNYQSWQLHQIQDLTKALQNQ